MEWNMENAVRERYAGAAREREDSLCCAPSYDDRYLDALPGEIVERDYGCGDPSRWVAEGEAVLDLGSGSGKACYVMAQVVGPRGRVIGVDFNDEMLGLARAHRAAVADRIGWDVVEFRRGRIQDLRTDLDAVAVRLAERPVETLDDLDAYERYVAEQRERRPLVADDSVDVVVSNCVLNLVGDGDKPALFREIHRVLRRGGRAIISDIVADEPVPERLKRDPELWSGCVSGAMTEPAFLEAFAGAGLYGVEILERDEEPWRTVDGIEFRSVTVRAWKGKEGPCLETNRAVIYRGPWREVVDDDGHTLVRGVPMAVCEKTFGIYTNEPYAADIAPVEPREAVDPDAAAPFDCARDTVRDPRETKGRDYRRTTAVREGDCDPSGACC